MPKLRAVKAGCLGSYSFLQLTWRRKSWYQTGPGTTGVFNCVIQPKTTEITMLTLRTSLLLVGFCCNMGDKDGQSGQVGRLFACCNEIEARMESNRTKLTSHQQLLTRPCASLCSCRLLHLDRKCSASMWKAALPSDPMGAMPRYRGHAMPWC